MMQPGGLGALLIVIYMQFTNIHCLYVGNNIFLSVRPVKTDLFRNIRQSGAKNEQFCKFSAPFRNLSQEKNYTKQKVQPLFHAYWLKNMKPGIGNSKYDLGYDHYLSLSL